MQFYEVPEEDLERMRSDFASGRLPLDISEQPFSLKCAHDDHASVRSCFHVYQANGRLP